MPAHMTLKKPRKGTATAVQRARRRLVEVREKAAKDAAKSRDGWRCRWCGVWCGQAAEGAHLRNKGAGGDHGRHSHHQRDYVTLCGACHRGPSGLHSGHIRAVYGPQGGDGPVDFVEAKT